MLIFSRNSSTKLSLSNNDSKTTGKENVKTEGSRPYQSARRFAGEGSFSSKNNPFNGIAPLTTSAIASPTSGASSAFGLGSGAFASFGASGKTPRTPGTSLDFGNSAPTAADRPSKEIEKEGDVKPKRSASSLTSKSSGSSSEHSLKNTWIVWYRPPTSKFSDYEKSTIALAHFSTVEAFWTVYTHLKRPSALPSVSDYHVFKKGIRPVWEDEENKRGGKWILRLKKGVSDRYWEDLLLAIVGDQFAEAGEEVCGAVLSIRTGEDVLSVWTRIDGGRNIKIRQVSSPRKYGERLTVLAEKQSSDFLRYLLTRTLCGRVMMIALLSGLPSMKLEKKRGMVMVSIREGRRSLRTRHQKSWRHRMNEKSSELKLYDY